MNQPLGLFRDVNETTFIPQGEDHIVVQQGDRIFADLKAAHLNVCIFLSHFAIIIEYAVHHSL
jgi:hypothetical protein